MVLSNTYTTITNEVERFGEIRSIILSLALEWTTVHAYAPIFIKSSAVDSPILNDNAVKPKVDSNNTIAMFHLKRKGRIDVNYQLFATSTIHDCIKCRNAVLLRISSE